MRFIGGGSPRFEGPRDIWRELAQADLRTLGMRTFRVYGPVSPLLDSPALASWERHDDTLVQVVLSDGSHFAAEGPYTSVQTAVAAAGHREWPLRDVVEDERERLFTHAGIDDSEAPGQAVESEPWFTVDGIPVRAELRTEGQLWAARLTVGGPDSPLRNRGGEPVEITVTGRGIAPDRMALRTVEDLQPYAVGRQELLNALAERREAQLHVRQRELPDVAGLDAHRRLVEYSVQDALRIEAALREGHRPSVPRDTSGDRGELWESAVRQQMRLAGEDREEANEAVMALVNQMVRLAERVDWFPGTEDGRAAVEESIRYTVFDSDVPSVAAQRAWQADWDRHMAPRTEEMARDYHRERYEENGAADERWLDQWQSWLLERVAAGS